MADNIAVTAGSGTTIAADDIAGVLVQRVKVTWGPDGTANDVDDATGKRLPVEVAEPIPAGTNNIGDVDIATVPAPLSTTGGGTEATALRVTIATDSTGVVSIDDNGGAITVDGTVTANLAAGTNAIGKLAANSGVDIGDVDVLSIVPGTGATNLGKAEDAGHSSGDTGVMVLAVRQDTMAALAGTTGDYIPLTTDANGRLRVVNHGVQRSLTWVTGAAASSGSNSIIAAPSAGNHLTIKYLHQQNETANATTAIWEDGTTDKIRSYNAAAGNGAIWQFEDGSEWRLSSATALQLNLSGANSHGYTVGYWTEAD